MSQGTVNSSTTKKKTTKLASVNFQKTLSPSYILSTIQNFNAKLYLIENSKR